MTRRSNDVWLTDLQQPGGVQAAALTDLRDYLRRAVFVYLRDKRSDLTRHSEGDLHALSDDFAQNALVSIQKNLHTFKGKARFTTWAYRFVINEAAANLRRRHYRNVSLDWLLEEGTAVLPSLTEQSALDPALASERNDMLRQIDIIMQEELNLRQRQAVVGVHLRGLSIQEMADMLDTSPNTVYKMLFDARKKLRAALINRRLSQGDILALFEEV